jgi:DNA-binding transcriptional ArsR family regulator
VSEPTRERVLAATAKTPNGVWPTANLIAKELRLAPNTVRRYLRELRDAGLVTRKTRWYGRLAYTWVYQRQEPTQPDAGRAALGVQGE